MRIAGTSDETRTEHFLNTSLKLYRLNQLAQWYLFINVVISISKMRMLA
jgi:hypothetical protein